MSHAAAGPLSSTGCWTVRPDHPCHHHDLDSDEDTRLPKSVREFDRVGVNAGTATQEQVYRHAAADAVTDLLNGINGCVFAYGQTGSGKSRESHAISTFVPPRTELQANVSMALFRHDVWGSGRPASLGRRS